MATQVHPAALRRASTVTDGLAEDVRRRTSNAETETAVGARALRGFRLGQTLEDLRSGWADAMARHRTYLAVLGDALVATAGDYRQSDAEVASSFAGLDRF